MAVSWMYSSRHHYNVLACDHTVKLGEYICKPPFCRPVYINMMWLTRPSAPAYNTVADSSVCATSDVADIFPVRLSQPGLHQHARPHLSA